MNSQNLELVLSRSCKHLDWCFIPDTYIEFCKRCGFALLNFGSQPGADVFNRVQSQPQPQATFISTHKPQFGERSYAYSPLELERREIRILLLKAGQRDDPIQCDLEHVNLQQGPVYEALSYTWADETGDDVLCKTVECGSSRKLLGITRNCEAALRRLRRLETDRWLWIDAICIDQSSILERNHQVKNMINIFRGATRVIIFLGEGNRRLTRLVDYISNDSDGQIPRVFEILNLLQCRWFHRVWVLQEVAVSKSAIVVYNDKQMSWEDLLKHSELYLRLMATRDHPVVLPPVVSFALRSATTNDPRSRRKLDLTSMLQVSRNCSCKDARDKVYAILALLRNDSPFPLRADYSPSVSAGWVYLQAAAYDIVSKGSLKMLSLVDGESTVQMPSWVPDWTMQSPSPLPLQLKPSANPFLPRVLPQGEYNDNKEDLLSSEWPLDSALQVRGQRCATVWLDQLMFIPQKERTDYNKIEQRHSHWLFQHSPNLKTRACWKAKDFWKSVQSVCPAASHKSTAITDDIEHMGIPAAFGGMCQECYARDVEYKNYFIGTPPDCCCHEQHPHFDSTELEKFMSIVNKYGGNRRLFGTDHSLGIGPTNIRNEDEIWILEGSEIPLILRPIMGMHSSLHFILVGACYVHALTRSTDLCSMCLTWRERTHITLGHVYETGPVSHEELRLSNQQLPCQDSIITIR
ncbi:hypothetical protein ACN47E_004470 [Coniothyrium glycines]